MSDLPERPRPAAAPRLARRALAIAVATASTLLAVLALELGSGALNERSERAGKRYEGSWTDRYFAYDERLGYRPLPSRRTTARLTVAGREAYDVVYTTDERSRRVTPLPDPARRERFALFLGCSFTFGEGVGDGDTLPARFAAAAPGLRPYNYGFSGYGPQSALALLDDPTFGSQVDERHGVAVYTYLPGHELRAAGSMRVYTTWGFNMPYYVLDGSGNPVRHGSLRTGRPRLSALYETLAASETLRYLKVDFPPRVRRSDAELTARILAAARDAFLRAFPGSRFAVLVFPTAPSRLPTVPRLRELGVEVIDLSGLFDPVAPGMSIPGDGHPTAAAYARVAERLAEDLGEARRVP